MGKLRRQATDAELDLLKEFWTAGPATARMLAERLYDGDSASGIATVQKLLQRLERKKLVVRERRPPAHLYSAALSQEQYAGEQIEAMAEKLSSGSLTPLLLHLIHARRLSKRERDELCKLIRGDG